MRAKQHQRAYRICTAQCDFFAMFFSQRFGDEEVTVKPVRQTKSSGDPERQPNVDIAERTANAWAENKAEAKRHADHAESACTLLFRRHVGDVCHGCWNTGRGDSRDNAAEKKPADRGRERHDDVVEAKTKIRKKNDRAPAEFVRQHTKHGRKEKLHQRKNCSKNAVPLCCRIHIAAQKIENQFRQHRCDQSEREHVEHDGDEDERDGGLARFHAGGKHGRNVVAAVVSTAEPNEGVRRDECLYNVQRVEARLHRYAKHCGQDNAFHLGYFVGCFRFLIARRKPRCARAESTAAVSSPRMALPKTKSWRSKAAKSLIEKPCAKKSRHDLVRWKFRSTRICSSRLSQTKSGSCRCCIRIILVIQILVSAERLRSWRGATFAQAKSSRMIGR